MASRGKYNCHEHSELASSVSTLTSSIDSLQNQFNSFYDAAGSSSWVAPNAKAKLTESQSLVNEVIEEITTSLTEITDVCGLIAEYKKVEASIKADENEKAGAQAELSYWQEVLNSAYLANNLTAINQASNNVQNVTAKIGVINRRIAAKDQQLDSLASQIG